MEVKNATKYLGYPVHYENTKYILTGCILRIHEGEFYYQAELTDISRKSVVIVPLKKVDTLEEEE